ncbi:MAG: anthranilate synthase component I [Acidocella sp. 20-57-95]|nr:MAG: anthranilate synthase component I [Acidocella sp. 20-57-95]OYV61763.1 MAG: anthranilate synthase component I [Acidocella sp. 21-58-7]HQT65489.1 anthranilate synthase component I [Acidocella sp.]HQU03438.1 anthranilate synthase component I [Acidocella sp.]
MNAAAPIAYDAFCAAYDAGRGSLVWRHDVADLLTPVAAFLKLAHGKPFSFLLESVEGGAARGRYSVIGMTPDLIWRCENGVSLLNRDPQANPDSFLATGEPPLDSLRALIAETKLDVPEGLPPMTGGLSGYLGYDMVRLMEDIPNANPDVLGIPEAILVRPSLFAIFDGVTDELTLAAPVYPKAGVSAASAYAAAELRLQAAREALDMPVPKLVSPKPIPAPLQKSNMSKAEFLAMVEKGKDYIRAGDVFQVVPSQRFEAPFTMPPFALYRSLRRINPAPFLFYLDFGNFQAVGSSPEILVRLRDGVVTIRPLAGTRKRGANKAEDAALEAELLNDPKERAEHLMLLDLGRNDVGRVAEIGSVKVVESFAIERFSHVMHISSTVEGHIKPGLDALDALVAGFPAGTLSGAPKVRAMQIIDELEPSRRGLYAGCIGYFAANGTMDTCIGLRTALVKDGTMYVQAGVGVVADSDPEAEYAESVQKARALFRAAEDAVRYAEQERAS